MAAIATRVKPFNCRWMPSAVIEDRHQYSQLFLLTLDESTKTKMVHLGLVLFAISQGFVVERVRILS